MPSSRSLYLVRHGLACDRGPTWPLDADRPLTDEGIAQLRRQFKGLRELEPTIDAILTSPLVRATQTADLLASACDGKPPITVTAALRPDADASEILAELSAFVRASGVALVGHEPSIGVIAGAVLGIRRPFPFKKGGVCRIDVNAFPPARPGELIWFLAPRVLRAVSGASR
ncbi:MAG: histidine phosphatase family protein [Acidobacteriota bacterium]